MLEKCKGNTGSILVVKVGDADLNAEKLKYIQEHQEEMQYSMKRYIEYIIDNSEEIKSEIPELFKTKRQKASKEVNFRMSEILTGLYIGYKTLMDFAVTTGVITVEKKEERLNECWEILIELGKQQNAIAEKQSPMDMLLSAIKILTNEEKLVTVDYTSAKYMKKQDIEKDGFVRIL